LASSESLGNAPSAASSTAWVLLQQPLMLGGFVVLSSLLPIMQRYLLFTFDPITLAFVRHVAGSLVMLTIAMIFARDELRNIFSNGRRFAGMMVLAFLYTVAVGLFIAGLGRTSAVMSSLISLLGLPLTLLLLMLTYEDERQRAKGRLFFIGAGMAFVAAAALALSNGARGASDALGTAFLIGSTLIQALSAIFTKRMVLAFHPLALSSVNGALMACYFGIGTLLWGNLSLMAAAPPATNALLIFSGVYGLLIGSGLYMANMKRWGMVVTRLAELATPVFTGLFGFVFFGEHLTPAQAAFGAMLIAGCMVILLSRKTQPPLQEAKARQEP
jgi:drug/metabolite transporter (DMT)-like permease